MASAASNVPSLIVADLMANSRPAIVSLKLSIEPDTPPFESMRSVPVASAVCLASWTVTVPSTSKPYERSLAKINFRLPLTEILLPVSALLPTVNSIGMVTLASPNDLRQRQQLRPYL